MIRTHRSLLWVGVLCIVPSLANAQGGGRRGNPNRLPPGQAGALPPDQRIGQMLRNRLQLTDAQVPRMQETMQHFQERRRTLGAEDMQTRRAMRDMICSGDTTRGAEMTKLIDQWHDVAKRRLQMQEEEQKSLAAFLTPYQRAKYIGFEEQVARLLDDRVGGRGRGMGPPPDGAGQGRGGGRGGQRMGPPPDGGDPRGRPGMPPPDACGPPPDGPPGR